MRIRWIHSPAFMVRGLISGSAGIIIQARSLITCFSFRYAVVQVAGEHLSSFYDLTAGTLSTDSEMTVGLQVRDMNHGSWLYPCRPSSAGPARVPSEDPSKKKIPSRQSSANADSTVERLDLFLGFLPASCTQHMDKSLHIPHIWKYGVDSMEILGIA